MRYLPLITYLFGAFAIGYSFGVVDAALIIDSLLEETCSISSHL